MKVIVDFTPQQFGEWVSSTEGKIPFQLFKDGDMVPAPYRHKKRYIRTTKSHTRWAPEDDKYLLEQHANGASFMAIAKVLGRTKKSVAVRYAILKARGKTK